MANRKHSRNDTDPHKKILSYIDKRESKHQKKRYRVGVTGNAGNYKRVRIKLDDTETGLPGNEPQNVRTAVEPTDKKEAKALKKQKKLASKAKAAARKADLKAKASRFPHHHGDRIDGRRMKTISGMLRFMAFVMPQRCDSLNTYADCFDITEVDNYCREKVRSGMTHFSILHVLLAAYVRTVSQKPGLNRFISGQEVFSRYSIDISMTVKKSMSVDAPDTCIKVYFEPTDTIDDVYEKFNKVVEESTSDGSDTDFDSFSSALLKIPRWLLRFFVWLLNKLDYHGKLPLSLLELSPFHGSMIITSMGSLGIKPIYHHIYNFGNLPIFLAYGVKRTVVSFDRNGEIVRRKYVDIKAVTDERICDGFYYASAFKMMKKFVEHPETLETPPETVYDDIP